MLIHLCAAKQYSYACRFIYFDVALYRAVDVNLDFFTYSFSHLPTLVNDSQYHENIVYRVPWSPSERVLFLVVWLFHTRV